VINRLDYGMILAIRSSAICPSDRYQRKHPAGPDERNSGGAGAMLPKPHWSAAALIITMLGLGLAMVLSVSVRAKFETYQLHRRWLFLFAVIVGGALWRMANPHPLPGWYRPGNGSSPAFTLVFISSIAG